MGRDQGCHEKDWRRGMKTVVRPGAWYALRTRRLVQLPLAQRPEQQPVVLGTAPGPGLRATSMAERAALAMVRTFPAMVGLMREALQGLVQTVGVLLKPEAAL